MVALCDKSDLMSINNVIWSFEIEDPFTTKDVEVSGTRNQTLCAVVE